MSNALHPETAPMNHLLTADSFLPHSGGSRVYYANLYRRLLEQYPDRVTVLTSKVPGWREFDQRESRPEFRIFRKFRPLPSWKYGQMPKAVPRLLREASHAIFGQYDCLHCGDLFPQALNGVLLKRLCKLPLLVYCHGDEISQTDQRRYQPRVRNFIYRRADVVVAANQFAVEGLLRSGVSADRITKLTPGVDIAEFHPRERRQDLIERYGLNSSKVVLTVARLVPRKGHRIVLEALQKVARRVPDVKYLIVGDGPEKNNLERLAIELGLQHRVMFAGDVPHDQICDYYNLCDVSILMNRLEAGGDVESFGMVFTEANATGKPVIGGLSGGTAEAVVEGKTGFLVEPNDAGKVADKLELLLTNQELAQRMGQAGLQRVRAEFDWNSRARALREISAEMVARSRCKGQQSATQGRTMEV